MSGLYIPSAVQSIAAGLVQFVSAFPQSHSCFKTSFEVRVCVIFNSFGIVFLFQKLSLSLFCASMVFAIILPGIFNTVAVTTVAVEMVNCTNHQVSGIRIIPRNNRGSIDL